MEDRTQSGFLIHHLWSFVFLLLFFHGHSFNLPGVAPHDFYKGDLLKVKVNKLASNKTQLPYPYYSMPYCRPLKIVDSYENLGVVLRGDRLENSPYEFRMRVPMTCMIVCRIMLNEKTAKEIKEKIDDEYRVNMILDNLPLVVPVTKTAHDSPITYQHGFNVGSKAQDAVTKEEKYFINNHLSFIVKYRKDVQTSTLRVVGFEVEASSVNHKWGDITRLTTCDPHAKHPPQKVDTKDITFTYDVAFRETNVEWASRWDAYHLLADNQIYWFSSVNSLVIVLFLSGMVAMIILRKCLKSCGRNQRRVNIGAYLAAK